MDEIDLKEIFQYYKNRIAWIIIAVLVVIIIGNLYTIFTRTPLYKSDTTITLVGNKTSESEAQRRKSLITAYSDLIKSRRVINKVIRNLELDYNYKTLSSRVSVKASNDSETIVISACDPDPKEAVRIVDELTTVFRRELRDVYKINNTRLVDTSVEATRPYNMHFFKENLLYVAVGLVLSGGIILIVFYFDTTIKNSDEIEKKLRLPVIGTIPEVEKSKYKAGSKRDLMIVNKPKSLFAESIRGIYRNLTLATIDSEEIRVIAITSPEIGDGKSFITANLASAYAQFDQKVLVIDGDLRRGKQHRIFDVANPTSGGYSNLIINYKEGIDFNKYIQPTTDVNVDVLTSGPMPPYPAELLASENNKKVLDKLKKKYDLIIFDSSIALGSTDALVIASLADVNLVAVSELKTKLGSLEKTKRTYEQRKLKIDGVILNKDPGEEKRYYSYYYSDEQKITKRDK